MTNQSPPPDPAGESSGLPARLPVRSGSHPLVKSGGHLRSAAVQSEGLTPAFVWRVFCLWWTWVLPLGVLLSLVAGSLVWFFHVPQYQASALVMIESDRPYIAFDDHLGSRSADRYVETQIELLQSPVVLAPVIGRPEIASIRELREELDPLKHLQTHLEIKQVGKSELYTVSYSSPSAQDAATVANVVVAEYLLLQARENSERSQFVIDVLEKERKDRGDRIQELRQRVVELAKEVTGKDPFNQGTVTDVDRALSPVGSIYQSLNEVEVDAEVLKAEIQALRDVPIVERDGATPAGVLDLEISNRADVRQLQARIAALDDKMADLKSRPIKIKKIGETSDSDPEYDRLAQQSSQAKAELGRLQESLRKEMLSLRQQQHKAEREQLIATKMQELSTLNKKRSLYAAKFEKEMQELKSGGAQSVQLEFARAELEREEKVFELIAARKLALQTESRAPRRVALKQSANVPFLAIDPIPYKLLLLACLGSLVFPMGLAVAKELIVQRVTTSEQLAKELLLPVLGEVARFPVRHVAGRQPSLPPRLQREMYVFAESIDSLRTNLMLSENLGINGQRRVIAICSAASGEGKTSVAAYLTISIAEATKQPTLVIDADLRSPDIADFFGVPTHPGVAEVLDGKASILEAIHRVGQSHAYVLPAGKRHVNPHHILHGDKIDKLLATLRQKFSTIIIDTPPILGASESLVYAKAADLVVFCSLSDVSRVKQARLAVDRLHSTGANLAGTVLSGVPVSRYVYSYGSYEFTPAT